MEETGEELPSRLDGYTQGGEVDIYTNVNGEFNQKKRIIYCKYCKIWINSNMIGAQCKKCNSDMITVIREMNIKWK